MQKFINKPEDLTNELLEGLALSNADLISLEQGNLVVNKKLAEADRVTIVTLGGTGKDVGKRHPTKPALKLLRWPTKVMAFCS